MAPSSCVLWLMACVTATSSLPGQSSSDVLIQALRSEDAQRQSEALSEIRRLGPNAAATVPVLTELLEKENVRRPQSLRVVDALGAIGAPAASALPTLVRLVSAAGSGRNGQSISDAIDAIATAIGPERLGMMLEATAVEARRVKPVFRQAGGLPELWDHMSLPRAPFNPARRRWGRDALPALRDALKSGDDDVRAEAAGWIEELSAHADGPIPWVVDTVPWLEDARSIAKSPWTRYQIDRAIERIRTTR